MPYNNTPFNFYGTQKDQVKIDLDNANNNFTILANAFKNNSPDTGVVKNADSVGGFTPSQTPQANQIPVLDNNANLILPNTSLIQTNTYTIRRVDLTNATSDYPLAVGEEAIINFTNATSVLLHIATQDGTVYEMRVVLSQPIGTSGANAEGIFLNPNNTTYSNAFDYAEIFRNIQVLGSNYISTYPAFRIGWGFSSVYSIITNKTVCKNIKGFNHTYGSQNDLSTIINFNTTWKDTTTPWTSLGTITFPQSTSGQILVRRIL